MHSSTASIKHSFGMRYFLITGFFHPHTLTAFPYSNLPILLSVTQTCALKVTSTVHGDSHEFKMDSQVAENKNRLNVLFWWRTHQSELGDSAKCHNCYK